MAGKAKICAISDNPDTLTGLALAGVSAYLVVAPDELRKVMADIATDTSLMIITSGLADKNKDILDQYRDKNQLPLITIIPELLYSQI